MLKIGDGSGDFKKMKTGGGKFSIKSCQNVFWYNMSICAIASNGKEQVIFKEDRPNSELVCRPLLTALADMIEQDKPSTTVMCCQLIAF